MPYGPLNSKVVNVGPPLTIVGKDLDVGATFNGDINPNAGKQRAGRFMSYDPATGQLTPWDGVVDVPGATIFGVLADDFDITADNTKVTAQCMVYRAGTFLRQEIESANNAAIPPGGALDKKLNDISIFLEYSYEGYLGLSPVPTGVVSPDSLTAKDQPAKDHPPKDVHPAKDHPAKGHPVEDHPAKEGAK